MEDILGRYVFFIYLSWYIINNLQGYNGFMDIFYYQVFFKFIEVLLQVFGKDIYV